MIPLFSTQQVREVDSYAITQLNMPSILLMENAALEIFNISVFHFQNLKNQVTKVGFICGKGNNGGDGFAAARHFANNGYDVTVIHIGEEDEMSPDALTNFIILRRLSDTNEGILIKKYTSLKDLKHLDLCDAVFDALLGSGAKGELKEPYDVIIQKVNSINAYKAAIDIPTGLDADTGSGKTIFKADLTITLGEFKPGLFIQDGYANCGKIFKGDIGVSSQYFDRYDNTTYLIEPEDVNLYLPKKKRNAHKYSAGKVFTIAGSGKLPGAAALTSKAVLRTGAGSSILAYPASVRKLVHKNLNEVIVESYADNGKEFLAEDNITGFKKRLNWADVTAIGPGLGREDETQKALLQLLKNQEYKRIVIDADAVFALSDDNYKKVNFKDAVLTPHHAEFANLMGVTISELEKNLLQYGSKFSTETGAYLVLKGAPTIIFVPGKPGEVFINTSGNPGMAKFGTGDVLTGIIAGFMAQAENIEEALICAVYLHSLSADLLAADYTEYGFTASDIIKKFPAAINFIRKSFV